MTDDMGDWDIGDDMATAPPNVAHGHRHIAPGNSHIGTEENIPDSSAAWGATDRCTITFTAVGVNRERPLSSRPL